MQGAHFALLGLALAVLLKHNQTLKLQLNGLPTVIATDLTIAFSKISQKNFRGDGENLPILALGMGGFSSQGRSPD